MVDAKAGLYVFLAIAFTCLVGGLLAVGIVEVLRSSGVVSNPVEAIPSIPIFAPRSSGDYLVTKTGVAIVVLLA